MKTFKLTLGALLLSSIVIFSCEKEKNESVSDNPDRVSFVPATENDQEQAKLEFQRVIKGEVETVEVVTPLASPVACCLNVDLQKVVAPWDPTLINLNVKYDVSDPNQVVQIKHWVNTGGGYVYFGQDNITTSYSTCTSKSVNMSTGHIPAGSIISWSRIWDGTTGSYCGGDKILNWTK